MVFRQAVVNHTIAPNYLGAIVSPDGSIIYWVNENYHP